MMLGNCIILLERKMKRKNNFVSDDNGLNSIVYTPENGNVSDLPLLIYLHGAGERGNNLDHLNRNAIPKFIENGREYNAVVLCPQCPADSVWDNVVERLKNTIDAAVAEYDIKRDRIVLTGSSMGGFGAIMMGMTYRSCFAGIAAVSGGGMSWRSSNLSGTPILLYHGDKDDDVPVIYSEMLYNSLKNKGYNAELKILEGYGHNDAINKAYEDDYLINWLLGMRRENFDYIPECQEELF